MSNGTKHVASAILGAGLALVLVFTFATIGMLPVRQPQQAQEAAMHRYLTTHPEVLVEMTGALQAKEDAETKRKQAQALTRLGMQKFFSPEVAFVTGPADAKTTLVEFFDYNCPYCRASFPAVKKFYDANKNTARIAFIEFPIKGKDSIIAARVAIAARKQPDKYLELHFRLMNEEEHVDAKTILADAEKAGLNMDKLQADMKDPATTKSIAAAQKLAEDVGIDGTPAFIVNGKMQSGAVDEQSLAKLAKS